MADDVTVINNSGNTGTDYVVATDEVAVGGNPIGQVQFVKLVDGTLNGTSPIAGDSANGLDVDITRMPTVSLSAATQVTVTAVAGTLSAANAGRKGLTYKALDSNTQSVWFGPATVSSTTGMELKPGAAAFFLPGEVPTNLVQAISTSGSQIVIVQESV
jgi:hypothetical protein